MMNEADAAARKKRVARRKFTRDMADFFFRVVQMWIVLALVWYFYRQSGSTFALVTSLVLTLALLSYTYVTPVYLLEQWEVERGGEAHALAYVGVLVAALLTGTPLLFSDMVIEQINSITHPSVTSPAAHAPHG